MDKYGTETIVSIKISKETHQPIIQFSVKYVTSYVTVVIFLKQIELGVNTLF